MPLRISKTWRLPAALLAFGLIATACTSEEPTDDEPTEEGTAGDDGTEPDDTGATDDAAGSILDQVLDRGTLNCGTSGQLPGFSAPDANGNMVGFDADTCRAIAAAVLGDAEAVEFRELTAQERFTALQGGQIDVLVRNTTATATRDGQEGATFQPTLFYDGQGFMVPADSDIEAGTDLDGATVCVLSGTTTELNLTSYQNAEGISIEPLTFADNNQLIPAFEAGQCDAMTTDKSGLAGIASESSLDLRILPDTISKEPLGPGTPDGDTDWDQVVHWVAMGLIQAEEFGINSGNIDDFLESDDPAIQRFLGLETEDGTTFDSGLGLPVTWAQDMIRQVGNYGELYEEHIVPLGLERVGTPNALWTDGGLMYSWPFR